MAPKTDNELKLERLRAKRENLFRRIQQCYDASETLKSDRNNITKQENFKVRYGTIQKTLVEYKEIVNEVISLKQVLYPEESISYTILDSAVDLYDRIEYAASELITAPTNLNLRNSSNNNKSNIHMPKIEIVKFDASDLSLWPLFYENFRQLIHVNSELSTAEKLQYLLGSLTGKALKTVSAVETIPSNYEIIFKLLVDTYHDKKLLSSMYLDRILNFRSTTNNNSDSLQAFLEKFDTNVAALKRLNLDDLSDYIITHIAMSKLSPETISAFELIRNSPDLPKYDELIDFIRRQSKINFSPEKYRRNANTYHSLNSSSKNPKTFVANQSYPNRGKNCLFCKKSVHLLKDCHAFKTSPHDEKFRLIKTQNLCLNCFSDKHRVSFCPSRFCCQICGSKHHSLLHRTSLPNNNPTIAGEPRPSTSANEEENIVISSAPTHTLCAQITRDELNKPQVVLLSTALVNTTDKWGREQTIRFLCDSASMSNILTLDCCRKLGLSYSKLTTNVLGIGDMVKPLKGSTVLNISSTINPNITYSLEVLIIDRITNALPDVKIDCDSMDHLKYLPLADPTFHLPGKIDGILGAAMFADILGTQQIRGPPNMPIAVQSALGYLIMGNAPLLENKIISKTYCTFLSLESLVEKMWEREDYTTPVKTSDDTLCENLYLESFSRDNTGRYTVALPFREDPSSLGNSYNLAKKRFISLEKRFENSPGLREIYSSIIQDYLDQNHMTLVVNKIDTLRYFIPHHCVTKYESLSTPNRIVFDASMKTDNGLSLNDILYRGPKLQNDIFTILLNFRLHPVCMCADLKAMYRQVNIIESHRPYQSILWRFDPKDDISVYELNTVTFGITSSPYLSLRTIRQLIQDEASSYPETIEYVKRDMFMDDLICSLENEKQAILIQSQMVHLFKSGGFQIVKWVSNSPNLLSHIPDNIKLPPVIDFEKGTWKVLGLQWNPVTDQFNFAINFEKITCTKRNMLSLLSRTYDPLGMLSPVTLFIKLLINKLWDIQLDWDAPAPKEIEKLFSKFQDEFPLLNRLKIPRHVMIFECTSLQIVGFADASASGIASVIYIRTIDTSGHVSVTFLCSQTKVAPRSKITLPRLELAAATKLALLIAHVRDTYSPRKNIENIYAFSDSMITLNWIHSVPKKWNKFVENRVTKIQKCLSPNHWYFIPGIENVSDCASRGLTPSALINHKNWFSGPSWLLLPFSEWPIKSLTENRDEIVKNNEILVHVVTKETVSPLYMLIEYFSSWSKLHNATVYVLRFIKILPMRERIQKYDLDKAEQILIRVVQQRHFAKEIKLLSDNKIVTPNIRRLNPFIKDGIIRVGGRLSLSNLNFDHKHPILLPKSDPFVNLLIDYNHKLFCHTGSYLLHSLLRQNYWILSARGIIRQRVWKCNHCFRFRPKSNPPLMADLPLERVRQASAFTSTGVDFTGAYHITLGRHRGAKSQKAYVCLFICLTTRAVHIELAADLSTESFLAALKRFLSRRGNCSTIFSDNATNFLGAKNQIDDMYRLIQSQEYKDACQNEFNIRKINWKFNPPSAPHMGGIWEANIKSLKIHLSKVIGSQILTYEELNTVLIQIECLMNSRPLCCLSNDANDLKALTPSHFLYSSPLNSFPAEDLSLEPQNRLSRYKLLDAMVSQYWKRWHIEYLSTLQVRQKWNTPSNPAKVNTVVVIIQDNLPPLQWPLAIIENLQVGRDGIARTALVRTKNSSYFRPIVKLCPLPTQ